jgi:ATP-binding cassette subfamily F protein 3
MIQLQNISLAFGNQKVFNNISHIFSETDRIGLVGRNGAGKSTLLKAIFEPSVLDEGTIKVQGSVKIAYMPQEVVLNSSLSIFEETFKSYKRIGQLYQEAQTLEPLALTGDSEALEKYGMITEELALLNIDHARLDTRKMLLGLGFKEEQLNDPVSSLSVGWQMRIVLAKLLVQEADFYLFDEPTNHLDIIAKDWFLEFLRHAPFGFLLICHDKYFLNRVCSSIFELELGKGTLYKGNYDKYVVQKEADLETLLQAHALQQRQIQEKEEWIAKMKAKANKARQAQSMVKALDKIERIEIPPKPKTVNFSFHSVERAGKIVLEVSHINFSYDKKQILNNINFTVERGDRIALVAPNGGGKTTLFNVICGKLQQTSGTITYGYNVKSAIFEQEQHLVLDPKKTIIEEVMYHTGNKTEQQIRSFLGAFLFGSEEVQKKTKVLSGGERNRVSMVKVLLQDANFLLLDEPTNHLDIQSKEILLKALSQFEGTILFVSHDHDFVNHLATKIIELTPKGAALYHGNYEAFLEQKRDNEPVQSPISHSEENLKNKNKPSSSNKEIHELERLIAKLEQSLQKSGERFAVLEYGTPEFEKEQIKYNATQKELESAVKQWEKLL